MVLDTVDNVAPVPCSGNTFLLRFMLQSLVSKQESLLLCKTLSSLLSYMNIDASPALNEVKLKVRVVCDAGHLILVCSGCIY